jgi:hypothetical protein
MKKEKKIKTVKFTRPYVEEELTEQNIKDIITSQEIEIENLTKEIKTKKECIKHYKKYLNK